MREHSTSDEVNRKRTNDTSLSTHDSSSKNGTEKDVLKSRSSFEEGSSSHGTDRNDKQIVMHKSTQPETGEQLLANYQRKVEPLVKEFKHTHSELIRTQRQIDEHKAILKQESRMFNPEITSHMEKMKEEGDVMDKAYNVLINRAKIKESTTESHDGKQEHHPNDAMNAADSLFGHELSQRLEALSKIEQLRTEKREHVEGNERLNYLREKREGLREKRENLQKEEKRLWEEYSNSKNVNLNVRNQWQQFDQIMENE